MNKPLRLKIIQHFENQANFSSVINVDESIVSRVIRGRRELSEKDKHLWAKVLNTKPEEIFSKELPKSETPTILEHSEEGYKPKAVPFSSSEPVPAPTPEQFKFNEEVEVDEPNKSVAPFRVSKKEELVRFGA